jgi:hypothetical protein
MRTLEPVHPATAQRVQVTFTQPLDEAHDGARLSEAALAADWRRDENDATWAHLQPAAGTPDSRS